MNMSAYKGTPFSPADAQADLMKSHVTRGVSPVSKTEGSRTLQLAMPPSWTKEAKCIGDMSFDVDLPRGAAKGEAARRCAGCPVMEQCLAAAMEEEGDVSASHRYLVRGGKSPAERAEIAIQGRVCSNGHTGEWVWTERPEGRSHWRCKGCAREDSARRYTMNPQDRLAYQREWRARNRAKCPVCEKEMHGVSLRKHMENQHGDTEEVVA